ncbi:hypothetical protein SARC_16559, partial [Sphaeroforma arctica JP610]
MLIVITGNFHMAGGNMGALNAAKPEQRQSQMGNVRSPFMYNDTVSTANAAFG